MKKCSIPADLDVVARVKDLLKEHGPLKAAELQILLNEALLESVTKVLKTKSTPLTTT